MLSVVWKPSITAVLLGAVAAACGDGASRESARAESWQQGASSTCEFAPLAASDPDLQFSRIASLDVDSRGRLIVADELRNEVMVLSGDGSLERTIGRVGSGPGEFRGIRTVQALPGDSVLAYDLTLARISIFPPDTSRVAYELNLAAISSSTPPNWVEKLPGEHAFFATHRLPFDTRDAGVDDYQRTQAVRLLEWDGRTRKDSILVVPAGQLLVAREGGAVSVTANPFGRPGRVRLGGDRRLYFGRGDSLAIEIYSLDGTRAGGFALPHAGPRVTSVDIDAAGERLDDVQVRALREQAPERWPAFRNFVVDDRGLIWIGLLAPGGQPSTWVAFDDQGTDVCAAVLPPNVDLHLVRGDRAYAVETGELDVPRILVYRLTRPAQ